MLNHITTTRQKGVLFSLTNSPRSFDYLHKLLVLSSHLTTNGSPKLYFIDELSSWIQHCSSTDLLSRLRGVLKFKDLKGHYVLTSLL